MALEPYFTEAELLLADIYYKNEEYSLSAEHAERIGKREPENFRSHLMMGMAFLGRHDYPAAIAKFAAAGQMNPESIAPLYYQAMAVELSGDNHTAKKFYQLIITKNPDILMAMKRYVDILIKEKRYNKAILFFTQLLNNSPNNPNIISILGDINFAAGNHDKAIYYFTTALNLMPGVPYSYMRLAQIYKLKKNWEAWQKIMLECIKNNPDYPPPYIKVAKYIQTNTGKTEDAINLLQKGKEHNPDSPQLINSLAWIYLENNINLNEAFFLAQKAYDLQPNDPSIADTLGWVYYKKKHYTRAGWLISQAESLAPDNPIVKYHSGMISLAKGKKKQAMQIFAKAVDAGLGNPELKEVKNIISQIESTTLVFTMDVLPVQLWTCRLLFLTFLEPGLNLHKY